VDKNIETLATALYVKIDDMLLAEPELAPWRPEGGTSVTVSDAGRLGATGADGGGRVGESQPPSEGSGYPLG
jgi:hypothetical protein